MGLSGLLAPGLIRYEWISGFQCGVERNDQVLICAGSPDSKQCDRVISMVQIIECLIKSLLTKYFICLKKKN